MSSANLSRFLNKLLCLVARPVCAHSHGYSQFNLALFLVRSQPPTWVDAFLYRASAMLPDDKRMILNVEYSVLPVTVPGVSGVNIIPVGYMD